MKIANFPGLPTSGNWWVSEPTKGGTTNWVIPDKCCGHQPVDLYIRACIFQNAWLTFGNQQSLRLPLCNHFVDIHDSFDTEIGAYREWINRHGITMWKLLCLFDNVMCWWVIVLKLPWLRAIRGGADSSALCDGLQGSGVFLGQLGFRISSSWEWRCDRHVCHRRAQRYIPIGQSIWNIWLMTQQCLLMLSGE